MYMYRHIHKRENTFINGEMVWLCVRVSEYKSVMTLVSAFLNQNFNDVRKERFRKRERKKN